MNARTHKLDLTVEGHQLEEALQAIFHAVLLHRSTGKFRYKTGGKYSIGTIGVEDVDCERIDFTYVRVSSIDLQQRLMTDLKAFCDTMRMKEMNSYNEPVSGEIELLFYQKKKVQWPFSAENIPWEVWSITVNIISLANEHERQIFSQQLVEMLCSKLLIITEAMNNHDQFTPKVPIQQELDSVYDTTLSDVQPFLFKVSHRLTDDPVNRATVTAYVKKILRDTILS